jgi:integrase
MDRPAAVGFCPETGTPLDESRVRKAFTRPLRSATLPGFRLYDLRHTFASLLLAQSAPITYVSASAPNGG